MYRLNKFLIQKNYNKTEKELVINACNEGIKINNLCKSVYNFINNKLTGEYLCWYENGQLVAKCYCNSNRINGKYQKWYKNGQLWEKCYYKNGKKTSEYKQWYKNGQLELKRYYKNNKLTSEYREWYENGQIWEKRYYKNDKLIYKIIKNHRLHL